MAKVKITVIKKIDRKEMFGENPPAATDGASQCERLETGQEFIFDGNECPSGFCPWAFADIQRDLIHVLFDGSFPWIKEKGIGISCCTDGLRPVIFKIEKVED